MEGVICDFDACALPPEFKQLHSGRLRIAFEGTPAMGVQSLRTFLRTATVGVYSLAVRRLPMSCGCMHAVVTCHTPLLLSGSHDFASTRELSRIVHSPQNGA